MALRFHRTNVGYHRFTLIKGRAKVINRNPTHNIRRTDGSGMAEASYVNPLAVSRVAPGVRTEM